MLCISRRDPNKNIFSNHKKNKMRKNFFTMINILNGRLNCAKESYYLEEMCYDQSVFKPCTLIGTQENVDLGVW